MQPQETGRPFALYFLMAFMFLLTTFIGYKFGGVVGAVIGFLFSVLVNGYALRIKLD